ncbi:ABC transporter ATP-binding protein [Rhizobium miluonense]|uniref:Multiple sugar transport system ATP-binding protein n=1 Tax=Rhizobium miluonense TaxID=411945 RepID=A0A1C3V7H9_9HYPH|nr:ABC transporter ATP-binding protein [Rhizobium miluonense]SCB23577.1 multiple sugar transport system ATP-binding protein [Rhizobium miluonense]
MNRLQLKHLTKRFGCLEVLHDVNLEIANGEFVVFVGPSGCGKSTLLRSIAGLENVTSGEIIIDGMRVNGVPPVRRGIAMVFQSYALYPHLNVFENIAFPLRVEHRPDSDVKKRVAAAAEILHLQERLYHKPGELSGGQRQRVAIGRAIVREPKIFLFDEPLSNLDAALRSNMRFELTKLHAELGATMIYVTHDQTEAMTMADKIVVMNSGKVEQIGGPIELYQRPANEFVASFIGSPKMNLLKGRCLSAGGAQTEVEIEMAGRVVLPVSAPGALSGSNVTVGIRPEQLRLGPGEHTISMNATVVERLGLHTVIHDTFDAEAIRRAMFTSLFTGNLKISSGDKLRVSFDPGDCLLFDANGIRMNGHVCN